MFNKNFCKKCKTKNSFFLQIISSQKQINYVRDFNKNWVFFALSDSQNCKICSKDTSTFSQMTFPWVRQCPYGWYGWVGNGKKHQKIAQRLNFLPKVAQFCPIGSSSIGETLLLGNFVWELTLYSVWPDKNLQMSIKVAQKWLSLEIWMILAPLQ